MPVSTRRAARGFTLMELMVVVIIIGILAALAIPSIVKAQDDRRAYNDAASLGLLLRSARMRAIGRGAAVAVRFYADGTADRGTFRVYEAVADTPGGTGAVTFGGGPVNAQAYPVSSCSVTNWAAQANTGANNAGNLYSVVAQFVDGLNFNGNGEVAMNLQSAISPMPWIGTLPKVFWLCFTPTGRVFAAGESAANVPDFANAVAFTSLEVCVVRDPTAAITSCGSAVGAGAIRHVLVPPSGMARVFSQ